MNAIVRAAIGFNYAALDPDLATTARATAERIKLRLKDARITTGRDLIEMKDRLGHGHFGAWLRAEFDMTERSAETYMNDARFLDGKSEKISFLPPASIRALAAPSAPAAVVAEVLAAVDAGKPPRTVEIKEKLGAAIEAERKAAIEAAKSLEQIKKDKKAEESKAQRAARRAAEAQAEEDQKAREEQERVDRLRPLVQRIADAIAPSDLATLAKLLCTDFGGDWRSRDTLIRLLGEAAR